MARKPNICIYHAIFSLSVVFNPLQYYYNSLPLVVRLPILTFGKLLVKFQERGKEKVHVFCTETADNYTTANDLKMVVLFFIAFLVRQLIQF